MLSCKKSDSQNKKTQNLVKAHHRYPSFDLIKCCSPEKGNALLIKETLLKIQKPQMVKKTNQLG